ncbi:ABC transporter ATP-binding protein [Lysinibacillus fusiformis]|nr:ABC transporter ATP-binding protein [Lysinibacillus fusiformis]
MQRIMEVQNITKQYKGKKVLENVSLSIYAQQIVALVGKNGSGKSTLLKIIGGLAHPDTGVIDKHLPTLKIGYVPEVTPSHILFTPEEYLYHMGSINGMPKKPLQQQIDSLLEIFNMQEARNTRIIHFSKGMKQKVMIMQAMLEETDLLILDEPLSGLDAKAQSDLEDTLASLKDNGLSIVLTCHETKLLENLVDRVFVIHNCQVSQMNSFHDTEHQSNRIIFEISSQTSLEKLLPFIEIQHQRSLHNDVNELIVTVQQQNTDKVLLALLHRNAVVKQLMPTNRTQEEFYSLF